MPESGVFHGVARAETASLLVKDAVRVCCVSFVPVAN